MKLINYFPVNIETRFSSAFFISLVKSKYAEIHVCCVRDAVTADMDEFVNLMATGAAGTGNIHQIPRTDVINLSRGGRAVQMDKAMAGLKKSLASFNLNF